MLVDVWRDTIARVHRMVGMMRDFWYCLLIVSICVLSYRVYQLGDLLRTEYEAREQARIEVPVIECNLPCRCKHLLGLGTWEWADCLGVGKK